MALTTTILRNELRDIAPAHIYTAWLHEIKLGGINESKVTLVLPTKFTARWVNTQYQNMMMKVVKKHYPFCDRIDVIPASEFRAKPTAQYKLDL